MIMKKVKTVLEIVLLLFKLEFNIIRLFPGQLYGLEKFWAFLKYYKHAEKLSVEPRLKEYLEKFKTIEDFRVLEPQIDEMLQGLGNLRQSPDKRRHRSVSESEGAGVSTTAFTRNEFTTTVRNEQNNNRKR